jgi:hypothetical protein
MTSDNYENDLIQVLCTLPLTLPGQNVPFKTTLFKIQIDHATRKLKCSLGVNHLKEGFLQMVRRLEWRM